MRTILLAAVLASAAAAGCSNDKAKTGESAEHKLPEMTPDQVEAALAANEATAIDCNGDKTRKKYGILPGAVLISDEEAFAPSELPADKTRKLVFYCSSTT